MTGPEHYREAESLLSHMFYEGGTDAYVSQALARAQAHATLALAAATALPFASVDDEPAEAWNVQTTAWAEAVSR